MKGNNIYSFIWLVAWSNLRGPGFSNIIVFREALHHSLSKAASRSKNQFQYHIP
jgi:hypothetical protein